MSIQEKNMEFSEVTIKTEPQLDYGEESVVSRYTDCGESFEDSVEVKVEVDIIKEESKDDIFSSEKVDCIQTAEVQNHDFYQHLEDEKDLGLFNDNYSETEDKINSFVDYNYAIVDDLEKNVKKNLPGYARGKQSKAKRKRNVDSMITAVQPKAVDNGLDNNLIEAGGEKDNWKSLINENSGKNKKGNKRGVICEVCAKMFKCKKDLKRHMPTHTKERPYECDICGNKFPRRSSLNKHKLTHTDERRFPCDLCEKSFRHKISLHRHMWNHSGEKPHKCQYCSKQFATKGCLDIHIVLHTNDGKFKCTKCPRTFHIKAQLRRHLLRHAGVKEFQCTICNKEFTFSYSLKEHMALHTGERKFLCHKCGASFTRDNDLQRHMLKHSGEKPFECYVCSDRFALKSTLKNHMFIHVSKVCIESESKGNTQLDSKILLDWSKGRVVVNSNTERRAIMEERGDIVNTSKHNNGSEILRNENSHSESGDTSDVNKDSQDSTDLEQDHSYVSQNQSNSLSVSHFKDLTRSSSESDIKSINDDVKLQEKLTKIGDCYYLNGSPFTKKVHPCHICGRIFGRKGDLEIHFRAHTGETPFVCNVCKKTFVSRSNLSKHAELHTGIRKFICKECDKRFSTLSNLQSHQLTHTGKKDFECQICLKRFTLKGNLTKHLKRHELQDKIDNKLKEK